jgi:hypothetical protein
VAGGRRRRHVARAPRAAVAARARRHARRGHALGGAAVAARVPTSPHVPRARGARPACGAAGRVRRGAPGGRARGVGVAHAAWGAATGRPSLHAPTRQPARSQEALRPSLTYSLPSPAAPRPQRARAARARRRAALAAPPPARALRRRRPLCGLEGQRRHQDTRRRGAAAAAGRGGHVRAAGAHAAAAELQQVWGRGGRGALGWWGRHWEGGSCRVGRGLGEAKVSMLTPGPCSTAAAPPAAAPMQALVTLPGDVAVGAAAVRVAGARVGRAPRGAGHGLFSSGGSS